MAPHAAFLLWLFVHTIHSSVEINQFAYPYALHADSKMNWEDANAFCADTYGTTLATIRNDSDARQLMEMVLAANCGTGDAGTRNTWIGLNDQSVHDSWEWVSGEECSADNCLGLDWWRTSRPTGYCLGSDECHCANIWWNVQSIDEMFNDGDCNNTMCFICDVSAQTTSTVSPTESLFDDEDHEKCCLDGWAQGKDCQSGCWNCACTDGSTLCGCAHYDNVNESDYSPPTVSPTESLFDDDDHKTCCIDGWAQGTDCQGGCWNCECTDGSTLCGCAHYDNVNESDYSAPTASPTESLFDDNDHEKCCLDGWAQGTDCQGGCWNCACTDGSTLCGCAHYDNVNESDYSPPTASPTESLFDDEDHKMCCIDGWSQGTDCQGGCWNCQCADGSTLCGCAHYDNVNESDYSPVTVDPTNTPTADPTANPTADPTADPTMDPTADPTLFADDDHKTCCIDGWSQGTDCQGGCWNCECTDGSTLCGCAHYDNVNESDYIPPTVSPTESLFADDNHKTCCLDGWAAGTDCQGGCWNCQCTDGSTLCGCAHYDNVNESDYSAPTASPTASLFDDDDHETCCLDGWGRGTDCQGGCWNCECTDGSTLCGCAHYDNVNESEYSPPTPSPTESLFDDEDHKMCCIDGWAQGKDCQGGCWNCACTDGSTLCGCAHYANVNESDYSPLNTTNAPTADPTADPTAAPTVEPTAAPTWFDDDNHKTCCLDGWSQGTDCQGGCWNCKCTDGSTLCGCAHYDNVNESEYFPTTTSVDAPLELNGAAAFSAAFVPAMITLTAWIWG